MVLRGIFVCSYVFFGSPLFMPGSLGQRIGIGATVRMNGDMGAKGQRETAGRTSRAENRADMPQTTQILPRTRLPNNEEEQPKYTYHAPRSSRHTTKGLCEIRSVHLPDLPSPGKHHSRAAVLILSQSLDKRRASH